MMEMLYISVLGFRCYRVSYMNKALEGRGEIRSEGVVSFRPEVGRLDGPEKLEREQERFILEEPLSAREQDENMVRERLEMARDAALEEAESIFPGRVGEVDPFADPEPAPARGFMQRLGRWAAGVVGVANVVRLFGGEVAEKMEALDVQKEHAEAAAQEAGVSSFEAGAMHHEASERIDAQEKLTIIASMDLLFATLSLSDDQLETVFAKESFAYSLARALHEQGRDISKVSEALEFSRSDVRAFTNEFYGLYAQRQATMGVLETMCGERIAPGPASSATVRVDALLCYDVYGEDLSRVSPPQELIPLIAAGNDLNIEELQLHRKLVAQAAVAEPGTLQAFFYGADFFPEQNGVYSFEEDMKPMLKSALKTTAEMATWSVKEGGVNLLNEAEREGYAQAFTQVVQREIKAQQAWYLLGASAQGVTAVGDAGRLSAESASREAFPLVASYEMVLQDAWDTLAAFEKEKGSLHKTAQENLEREKEKVSRFLAHMTETGKEKEAWLGEQRRVAEEERLVVRE